MVKEVSNRKRLGQVQNIQALFTTKVFDQFLLVGIPPGGDKKSDPAILTAFPPFEYPSLPLARIIPAALPTGANNSNFSKGTRSNIPNLVLNDITDLKNLNLLDIFSNNPIITDEFVFQINSGDEKVFGICIHVVPKSSEIPFFASKTTKKFTFCFCLLTHRPILHTHFTFLNYLVNLSLGKVKNDENLNNDKMEVNLNCGTPIEGLDLIGHIGVHPSITLPAYFEHEIERYYVASTHSNQIELCKDITLNFPPPQTLDEKSILWASIDTLFSVLSVHDIVNLLSALLLDAQVLIIGSNFQEVSMSVYALENLLKPFNYSGTVMPILPTSDSYLDLLYTPTPFLFGIPPIPKLKKMKFLESTYLVNIDKHYVPPVDFYPKFPNYDFVCMQILRLITLQKGEPNPFRFPPCFTEMLNHKISLSADQTELILREFKAPLDHIMSDELTCFFVTDTEENITIFNQELFLAAVNPNDLNFYEFLMESQTFQEYVEMRLNAFTYAKQRETGGIRRKSSFLPAGKVPTRKKSLTSKMKDFSIEALKLTDMKELGTD
ncbi:hypothetical protein TRFO_16522 [Tritrichomonas foetus]|uniref:UDENN domain-containing protein n=1 Tax=Tritrichomonas foetus TaxID=1144522 RepID=A0A1J4KQ04_9EUKA|nr:hypothetical protein TRFO_16522 [Tritrichomonas foetus]|eukprot:OHT13323.1 hypothetical protein TRFO_16522 [Tritrichomonas foetus]